MNQRVPFSGYVHSVKADEKVLRFDYTVRMKLLQALIILTLLLSIVSLFLEQSDMPGPLVPVVSNLIDYAILLLVVVETAAGILAAPYKRLYLKEHLLSLAFVAAFIILFVLVRLPAFFPNAHVGGSISLLMILLRNTFLVLKIFGRFQKFSKYVENFTIHPAQTILLSFLIVILIGALVLMMGFTTRDGRGLSFIDGLFTATSAVCVTGLIVVDTAAHFTVWGQLVILFLIQIGGLGIMMLSFFAVFAVRRTISLSEKMLLSYMLSEDDMSSLVKSLRNIIVLTVIIETVGAILLFVGFSLRQGMSGQTVFLSVFHSISAFCNAGFSLFSDSLESYRNDPLVLLTVAGLIILGGLSFVVILNLLAVARRRLHRPDKKGVKKSGVLSLNSRVVLKYTLVLLVAGIIFVYATEHGRSMRELGLGEQYLSAFFQSVTLRTAGFNSIPFDSLARGTYLFMIVFMFIGAASGGTAGGIKINTVATIGASVRAFLRGDKQAHLGRHSVPGERVNRSYLILLFGICSVLAGTLVLTLTETGSFLPLLFEATSAFGTVGLSAGVTAGLSPIGKTTIILLMFMGRLGPLTILSAAGRKKPKVNIEYPMGDISIG